MPESFVEVSAGTGTKLHSVTTVIGANTVHDEVVKHGEHYLSSYTVSVNNISIATAASHPLQIMAGASLKVRVRRIEIHQAAAATTAAIADFQLIRLTTAGTGGTSATPTVLDPSDSASGATAMTLPTAKGTEGTLLARARPYLIQTVGASTPWVSPIVVWDFDRLRSKPVIIAAGTSNGICIKNEAAHAGAQVTVLAWIDESNF